MNHFNLAIVICAGLSFWFSAAVGATGGEQVNGGDTVKCSKDSRNPFEGYFSLDYLLTLREDNSDIIQVRDWEQSRERILRVLTEKYPDLALLLRDFLSRVPGDDTTGGVDYYLQKRLWIEAPYGLVDIKDERVVRKLPPNCYKVHKEPDEIELIQSVIRQTNRDVVIYNYDTAILRELKTRAPLQYSFLIMHEWMWDSVQDPEVIRRVNRFLHSKVIDTMTASDFKEAIKNLGLDTKVYNTKPVCDRTPQIRMAIERGAAQPCADITSLDGVREIGASSLALTTILPGDFSGLGKVLSLDLSKNNIDYLFGDGFYGMPSLQSLTLFGNQLKSIPAGVFAELTSLQRLDLSGNGLTEISTRAFPVQLGYTGGLDVYLQNNKIETLHEGWIKEVCSMPYPMIFYVKGNPLRLTDQNRKDLDQCPTNGLIGKTRFTYN
jgi:hypothetical protein